MRYSTIPAHDRARERDARGAACAVAGLGGVHENSRRVRIGYTCPIYGVYYKRSGPPPDPDSRYSYIGPLRGAEDLSSFSLHSPRICETRWTMSLLCMHILLSISPRCQRWVVYRWIFHAIKFRTWILQLSLTPTFVWISISFDASCGISFLIHISGHTWVCYTHASSSFHFFSLYSYLLSLPSYFN